MATAIKTMVSKKKIRYKGDGYNLDLTYITDRLIAMGFPAEKLESLYRNSMDDVKKFLDEKHPDHYKIYNLCSERNYDAAKFHGRVAHYPFADHHPPKFSQIGEFCEDVTEWLQRDQQNVAVVHCKAGKGRTGVMICCFLLHSKVYATAKEVLEYYGKQRTQNEKGVTIPSQIRYINYYDVSLRNRLKYNSVKMYLKTVVLDYVPSLGSTSETYYLQFEVRSPSTRAAPYTSVWHSVKSKGRLVRLEVNPPLLISDDVKIEFSYRPYKVAVALPKKEFHFWLNTFFFDKDFSDSNLAHEVFISQAPHKPTDQADDNCSDSSNSSLQRKSSNDSDFMPLHAGGLLPERHVSGTVPATTSCSAGNDCEDGCVRPIEALSNLVGLSKTASVSDDTLLKEQQQQRLNVTFAVSDGNGQVTPAEAAAAAVELPPPCDNTTTQTSFMTERMRHSSVPQSATWTSRTAANSAVNNTGYSPVSSGDHTTNSDQSKQQKITIDGMKISLKLEKMLIDKACKGKNIPPNFGVTLLMVKPDDQSDNLVDYTASFPQQKTPLSSQSSGESLGPWSRGPTHQPLSNSSSAACVSGQKLFAGSKSSGEQSSPESSSEEECVPECDNAGLRTKCQMVGQTPIRVYDRRRHHTKGSQPATSSPLANYNSAETELKHTKPSQDQLLPRRSNSNVEPRLSVQFKPMVMLNNKATTVQSTWT